MLRNEVSKKLGIDTETLRFYENEGLIAKPQRLDNGYRFYSKDSLTEIKFILHCRSLGLGLQEVHLLKSLSNQTNDCTEAKNIIEKKFQLIDQKIKELKNLKKQLKNLSDSCSKTGAAKDCEIVKSLNQSSVDKNCVCHPNQTAVDTH